MKKKGQEQSNQQSDGSENQDKQNNDSQEKTGDVSKVSLKNKATKINPSKAGIQILMRTPHQNKTVLPVRETKINLI